MRSGAAEWTPKCLHDLRTFAKVHSQSFAGEELSAGWFDNCFGIRCSRALRREDRQRETGEAEDFGGARIMKAFTWASLLARILERQAARATDFHRLADHAGLLRFRAGHRVCPEALYAHEQRFFPCRPVDAGVDLRTGFHLRDPGRAGSHRDGCLGGEVWHCDEPLLLDWRDPRDGVRGHLHDAVLLRIEGAIGAGVSAAALR